MIEGTSYIVSLNRKPYPQGWTEKYGKYLKELTNLIQFLARNRRFFYDTFYLNQTNWIIINFIIFDYILCLNKDVKTFSFTVLF